MANKQVPWARASDYVVPVDLRTDQLLRRTGRRFISFNFLLLISFYYLLRSGWCLPVGVVSDDVLSGSKGIT